MSKDYLYAYENIKSQVKQLFGQQVLPASLSDARFGIENYTSAFHKLACNLHQHKYDPGMVGILCERLEQDLVTTQEMTGVTQEFINYLDYT